MIVSTLPITPRPEAAFSTLLSPFLVDLVVRFAGAKGVVAMNLSGRRALASAIQGDPREWYLSMLNGVGVTSLPTWDEISEGYRVRVEDWSRGLLGKGLLRSADVEVQMCPCGAVEVESAGVRDGSKLYVIQGGRVVCGLCKGRAEPRVIPSLLLSLPPVLRLPHILPGYARCEAVEAYKHLSERPLRVTRFRETDLHFFHEGVRYFLDTDYVWSFMGADMVEDSPGEDLVLVTSNRTISQAIRVSAMKDLMCGNSQATAVLVNPTLTVSRDSESDWCPAVLEYVQMYRARTRRFLLAQGLNWSAKEVRVSSSLIYWLEHSLYPSAIPRLDEQPVVQGGIRSAGDVIRAFMLACCPRVVNGLVVAARKARTPSTEEMALWRLLS